jgi:hypothetical protein
MITKRILKTDMKAKDMARMYREAEDKDKALNILILQELQLSKEMLLKRGNTNAGGKAVFRELELKWESFVRQAGDPRLNPKGFRDLVIKLCPEAKIMFINPGDE